MLADNRAFVLWGIEDRTLNRVGTTIRLAKILKGGEALDNWLARIIEPRLMMEFHDFEDPDGKHCSLISVEPTYDRPVRYAGQAYIRVGQNFKSFANFPDYERALWIATTRHKFEDAVATTHQTDQDVFQKLDTAAYYQLTGIEQPKKPSEILRRFSQSGYLRNDMEGGYDTTNLGALLFAKDLTTFPSFANKSVRLVKYAVKDKRKSEDETEGKSGYAVGSRGLLKFFMDRLLTHETYNAGARRISSTYSETAIREIIANAKRYPGI